jgi:hypothetical protein
VKRALFIASVLVGCAAPPAPRTAAIAAPTSAPAPSSTPVPATCDVMAPFPGPNQSSDFAPQIYHPSERLGFLFSEPLHLSCGIPHSFRIALEIVGQTCMTPFQNVHKKWDMVMGRDHFETTHYTAERYAKGWSMLLDVVKDIVDPRCIAEADAAADSNPTFTSCPMPAEFKQSFRYLADTEMESNGIGSTPAGLYAFVSALAARDSSAMGRMVQLKLLYASGEAQPVSHDHRKARPGECTPEGFYPDGLESD